VEAALYGAGASRPGGAPTINLDDPSVDTPIDLVPLTAKPMKIDTALSNSLDFGGTNASVVFKKAPDRFVPKAGEPDALTPARRIIVMHAGGGGGDRGAMLILACVRSGPSEDPARRRSPAPPPTSSCGRARACRNRLRLGRAHVVGSPALFMAAAHLLEMPPPEGWRVRFPQPLNRLQRVLTPFVRGRCAPSGHHPPRG